MSKKSAPKVSKKSIKDDTFHSYIYKILKNVHPAIGISKNAMLVLSRLSLYIVRRYATECSNLLISSNKKVVDIPTIVAATFIIYDTDFNTIGAAAIAGIEKAVETYESTEGKKDGNKKHRREFRAGLQMSVSRVKKVYKAANASSKSISDTSAVAIAASLEYLLKEIIDLSGNGARDNKLARITPRYLTLAIENDEELSTILSPYGTILGGGGVVPNIHAELLPLKVNKD